MLDCNRTNIPLKHLQKKTKSRQVLASYTEIFHLQKFSIYDTVGVVLIVIA